MMSLFFSASRHNMGRLQMASSCKLPRKLEMEEHVESSFNKRLYLHIINLKVLLLRLARHGGKE
jgi:hypothetical protein